MRFRRHQEAAKSSTGWLLGLFALVVAALVVAVNLALALVYRISFPMAHTFPKLFFETNTLVVLLFVLGGCWLEGLRLREGGSHVARMAGARLANTSGSAAAERLERRFANIVKEMAIASRVPAPAAWVLPRDDAINAFAAGWAAHDAVIVVTLGAMERLTREELQGVVAHEFSHIAHGDTRLNMRLIGLVWGLQMLFMLGRSLAEPDERGRWRALALFGVALQATGAMGWISGRLLQAAVSRQREFLADASAVKYTRVVDGIGGALRKIAHQAGEGRSALHGSPAHSLAHLYLHEPSRQRWWSTHPPIRERLRRLYGSEVEALPDPMLPAPSTDEPLLAFAATTSTATPAEHTLMPQASRHDATQNPAWQGNAARESDSMERIERWHGPGQCHAAILVLLQADDRDSPASLRDAAQRELASLGLPVRVQVLQMLTQRMGQGSPEHVRHLLKAAGDPRADALAGLRRLALRRFLHAPTRGAPGSRCRLEQLRFEIATATSWMAAAMGLGAFAERWCVEVLRSLDGSDFISMQQGSLHSVARLRRLHPMQRPLLLRAWAEAMPIQSWRDPRVIESMHLVCRMLDTPLPEQLSGPQ